LCALIRYCSALPSLDGCFGSLGSFFDFRPLLESFEANPPFVPEASACSLEASATQQMSPSYKSAEGYYCFDTAPFNACSLFYPLTALHRTLIAPPRSSSTCCPPRFSPGHVGDAGAHGVPAGGRRGEQERPLLRRLHPALAQDLGLAGTAPPLPPRLSHYSCPATKVWEYSVHGVCSAEVTDGLTKGVNS